MQSSQKDNIEWIKEDSMRFFYCLQILFHFQKISLLIFYHLLHIQQLNKEFKDHLLTKRSIKLFHQRRHKVFILSIQTINLVYKSSFYSSTYCLVASSFSDLFLLLVSFWGAWLCYKYKLIQMSQTNYKGLPNIGATCYINSFLQTLFMTPQFRQGIYEWIYNEKIHPKQSDSILFQLQKLFAKLQLGYSDISTKDLVKSFQWQDDEAFNQQDIQQFNRVLFQALQKSLYGPKGSRSGLIKQLYEGELAHFTKCLECHNQSAKQETFQDLILIIKNIYEKVYNSCIQLSLQRYIKPEILDQDNLYDCSVCGKKVRAQRGVKFIKLPKLLNVVLQRFHFDYYTMTRNKINDKFTFPHVLNFNHYFNGYDQIPNKINEDSSEYFLQQQIPKKVVKSKPPPLVTKKVISKTGTTSTQPAVAGKVKTKPSATTKSFLQEMRKKKMQQQMQNQDLIFVSGNATAKQPQEKQTVTKSEENNNHVMQAQVPNGNLNDIKQEPKQIKVITKYSPGEIPPPPPLALLEAMGPPVISDGYSNANINEIQQINGSGETIQKQLQRNLAQKEKLQAQKQKELEQLQIKNRQLVQQYLKDGPLVYELYSILVHSGTSNAGHYFSYIKSFDNGRWYHFNDQRVTQINVTQIQKTFGGSGLSNAYVLYYRLVEQPKSKIDCPIPEYIKKIIKQEEEQYKMRQISKKIDLENTLILKIYFQLGVKTIEILKNSTFSLLFQKCKQTFNVKALQEGEQVNQKDLASYIKKDNIRLRLFNPVNDSKLDTYTGRQDSSLEQLGIRSYQNFILQVKADSQQFDEYMTGFMSVRIALWQQNQALLSLQQKNIKLHKISINKVANMFEFESVVKKKRVQYLKQPINQNICIVKRHQNDEYLYHQIINLPDYYSKTVDNVGIFEGEILFVEADSENLNWPKQFENQINRITIKFINADNSQSQTLTTDSRISLNVLKEQVCAIIHQSVDQTIVRRGNRSGLELKTSTASLKQNRFINGTTLYLQRGIPAKQGQIRIQLFLSQDASLEHYNRLHQFQFISDVPIDTNLKASEVKNVFKNVLKRLRNVDYDCDKMRIRQKVNDKMGKIYREKPMKEQQLIEKREIAIELKQDNLQLKDYSIYVRVWNQNTWKLSQKLEFIVNKATTMKELAKSIYSTCKSIDQQNAILPEQMDICRILSIHKFNIIDLVDMEYFGMISEVSVLGEPMFVNSDGLLYIIKQTGIQPRALTKEQQNLYGGKVKATVRPTKGRSATSNPVKKQKGITIKVVLKMQEQEKQQ